MILDAKGKPFERPPNWGAFAKARDRAMAGLERQCAIDCLKWLHWDGSWTTPDHEPTEEQIARFIEAMHENPRVVPSFDPGDP